MKSVDNPDIPGFDMVYSFNGANENNNLFGIQVWNISIVDHGLTNTERSQISAANINKINWFQLKI